MMHHSTIGTILILALILIWTVGPMLTSRR